MTLKTDKAPEQLVLEGTIAQLRHAYENLIRPAETPWDIKQRLSFANGLLAPQIENLERVAGSYTPPAIAVDEALIQVEAELMAHANEIASASQARRIIHSIISRVRVQ